MADKVSIPADTCPVCLDAYEKQGAHRPYIFTCNDGACQACVTKIGLKEGSRCPVCAKVLTGDAIINVALAQSLCVIVPNSAASVPCFGLMCAKLTQPNDATVYCAKCDGCLCQSCSDAVHSLVLHKTVPLSQRPITSAMCEAHSEKKNYFCETCKTPVCHTCTLTKQHKGHTIVLLEDAVSDYKAKIKEAVCDAESWMKDLAVLHTSTMAEQDKHTAVKGDDERSPLRKNILEFSAKAIARIEAMRDSMLEKLEEHEVNYKAALNEALSEAGTAMTMAHLATERARELCETDDITFMSNAQNILDLLSQATDSTVHRVHDVQLPFTCDMAKIETSCVLDDGEIKTEEVKSSTKQLRLQAEEEERLKKAEEEVAAKKKQEEERRRFARWKPHPNATLSEDGRTLTSTGTYLTQQCQVALGPASGMNEFTVKIIKNSTILIGIATDQISTTTWNYNIWGWYLYITDGVLFSGPPHSKSRDAFTGKCDQPGTLITVRFDYSKGELSFVINGKDCGVAYSGIPTDKPLYPTVEIQTVGGSVELLPL